MSIEQLTIRPLREKDEQLVLELMRRCDIAEYGEPDTELSDLRQEWALIDLSGDGWLALAQDGAAVGYAALIPRQKEAQVDFYADPTWETADLPSELLRRSIERAREGLRQAAGELRLHAYVAHVNTRDIFALESAGFDCVRYHFQMRVRLDAKPLAPIWPAGVRVRPAVPGSDDRAIYELIQRAFREPGELPDPFEEWKAGMLDFELFDPKYWLLAEHGPDLVGASLCFAYPGIGWVRQLGVEPAWQRRGVGGALLLHSFGVFFEHGFGQVGLGVRADNPDALHVYERAGMKIAKQYDKYDKIIRTEN